MQAGNPTAIALKLLQPGPASIAKQHARGAAWTIAAPKSREQPLYAGSSCFRSGLSAATTGNPGNDGD